VLSATTSWDVWLKTAAKYAAPLIDILHELITGIGITVDDAVSPAETHLNGGPDMHFTVTVKMVIKLPPLLVHCGWLAGDVFPGYGPVKDVNVSWDNSELAPWGSFTCDPVGCDKTGPDGQARETFTPGTEDVHKGIQIYERGLVHAIAFVGSSLGNKIIGKLGDLLRVTGGMAWEVRHHKTGYPTGFTADVHSINGIPGYDVIGDFTITAVRANIKNQCEKAGTGCSYTVKDITGTVTQYVNSKVFCTAEVPPFRNLVASMIIERGKTKDVAWGVAFATKATSNCPDGIGPETTDNAPLPVYDYGETNTTVNLINSGGKEGTAVIHWQY